MLVQCQKVNGSSTSQKGVKWQDKGNPHRECVTSDPSPPPFVTPATFQREQIPSCQLQGQQAHLARTMTDLGCCGNKVSKMRKLDKMSKVKR